MFRSTDGRRRIVAAVSGVVAGAGLGVLAPIGPAVGEDLAAPVLDIVAPVIDLELPTSDLQGTARVEQRPDRVKVVLNSNLLFARDSARLQPRVDARLEQIAGSLRARGPGKVAITGFTDDLGSKAHGLTLSRQRAQAVARAIRPLLSDGYVFAVDGKGEAEPAVPNTDEANRRLNRRVVVVYTPAS